MFIAIDKNTNEYIVSYNIRDKNYKDTYNKELRYKCVGSCQDNNVVFVNSIKKTPHFRHSYHSKCSAHNTYIEFNKDFYLSWFNIFKSEYRKPYWFNYKLEEITDENNVIIIRYSQQKSEIIKKFENYSQNKIIWILSLDKRKYSKITHYRGKIYVDFIGSKNDIPLFNNKKSIVYLDTGYDILLKVYLNNTNTLYGQEIEPVSIYKLCDKYSHMLIAYPYRQKDLFYKKYIDEKKLFKEQQEKEIINTLYDEYKKEQNILNNYYHYIVSYFKNIDEQKKQQEKEIITDNYILKKIDNPKHKYIYIDRYEYNTYVKKFYDIKNCIWIQL